MKRDWKKEAMRDVLALGSWFFYALVIGRALIEPYRPFVDQLVLSGLVIMLVGFDAYVSRCLILVVFTGMFYESLIYALFASIVGLMLVFAAYALGKSVRKVIWGLGIGLFAIACGYFWAMLTVKLF
jgi:hypothetical protein